MAKQKFKIIGQMTINYEAIVEAEDINDANEIGHNLDFDSFTEVKGESAGFSIYDTVETDTSEPAVNSEEE